MRNLPPHECWPSEEEFLVGHLPSTSFPSSSFPLPLLAIPKVAGTFGLQQRRRRAFPLPLRNFFYLCAVFGWGVEPAAAARKDGGSLSLSAALPNPTLLLSSGRFERGGTPNCQIKCADLCAPPNDLDGARPGTLNNSISPFPIRKRRGNK